MIIIIGAITVLLCIFGGFVLEQGNIWVILNALMNEVIIIAGGAAGSLIIMAPKKVLMDIVRNVGLCLKGTPYNRAAYDDLLKVLYELFLLGRRNGMIALEEHVLEPKASSIFKKYPRFTVNEHAVEFLCGALRPIIDGKIKPDQLRLLLDAELERKEIEHHAPVSVMQKTGDALPGFGIVAAVLGIVITMASITGAVEVIGTHVAAALVGTFLEQRVPADRRRDGADVQVAQERQIISPAHGQKKTSPPRRFLEGRLCGLCDGDDGVVSLFVAHVAGPEDQGRRRARVPQPVFLRHKGIRRHHPEQGRRRHQQAGRPVSIRLRRGDGDDAPAERRLGKTAQAGGHRAFGRED
jgi:chemotaxis protein MotA